MADRINYLTPMQAPVARALVVARQLDTWAQNSPASWRPCANLEISADMMMLRLGVVVVWDSEDHERDDLTMEKCLARYKEFADDVHLMFCDAVEEAAAADIDIAQVVNCLLGSVWPADQDIDELGIFIESWPQSARRDVVNWAGAILYLASDNDDVVVPPIPDVIKHLFTQAGHWIGPAAEPRDAQEVTGAGPTPA